MDIIKNTLNIHIRHLRQSTIEHIRNVCKIEHTNDDELYISLEDVERYISRNDMDLMNDLRALVEFAKFMNCDAIHLFAQGKVLAFLTHYLTYKCDNAENANETVELAYYGSGLMYKKNITKGKEGN